MKLREFHIENFRSLKDTSCTFGDIITVFHGANNSGKSNLLASLEYIFKRKQIPSGALGSESVKSPYNPTGFYNGILLNFTDNFFIDPRSEKIADQIKFSVKIDLYKSDIGNVLASTGIPPFLGDDDSKRITLQGTIVREDDETSRIILTYVMLDDIEVLTVSENFAYNYFPNRPVIDGGRVFERLMNCLNDCFKVINARRYLGRETDSGVLDIPLSAENFQNWLFQSYLSKSKKGTFDRIQRVFNSSPFNFGEIGFAKDKEEIMVTIKKNGLSLPISRIGSGLQQILMLIAFLIDSEGKMIGIEELEINLSPHFQGVVIDTLRQLITESKLVSQIILTSHSNYVGRRPDNTRFAVTMSDGCTAVEDWEKHHQRGMFAAHPRAIL